MKDAKTHKAQDQVGGDLVSFFDAEKGENGEAKILQRLESLVSHLKDEKRQKPDYRVEVYEGFQTKSQIRDRLDKIGYPSLLGCYSRLPRDPLIEARVSDQIAALEGAIKQIPGASDIPLDWNLFSKPFGKSGTKRIFLYGIQLGTRSLWLKLLQNIFAKGVSLKNCFFIFYWLPPAASTDLESHRRFMSEFEVKDKLWSYSRFLRDFLVSHQRAIEVPLIEDTNDINLEPLRRFLTDEKKAAEDFSSYENFVTVSQQVRKSLIAVYGSKFEWLKEFDSDSVKDVGKFVVAVAQLYLHNRSIHSTADKDAWKELEKDIVGGPITSATGDHGVLGELDKRLAKFKPAAEVRAKIKEELQKDKPELTDEHFTWSIGENYFWSHFLKTMSSLTAAYVTWRPEISPSFLCIDDNPRRVESQLKALTTWFEGAKVSYVDENSWAELIKKDKILDIEKLGVMTYKNDSGKWVKEEVSIKDEHYDFFLIDLEYQGVPKGFELLQKLRSETRGKKKPFIITLSRRDDPESIQRSLNSGALFHITKSHFFDIIPAVCQVWKHIDDLREEDKVRYAEYENWHLLSKLPLRKTLELQSSWIRGTEYRSEPTPTMWEKNLESSRDYQWIRSLPKADLHCHIGSCMGPDLLPKTALSVLSEFYAVNEKARGKLNLIIKFLMPIVCDPWLDEWSDSIQGDEGKYHEEFRRALKKHRLAPTFEEELQNKKFGLFQLISNIPLKENLITPEEALLSPFDTTLERELGLTATNSTYVERKIELRREDVSYDLVMLHFILLLYCRQTGESVNWMSTENGILSAILSVGGGANSIIGSVSPLLTQHVNRFANLWEGATKGFDEYLKQQKGDKNGEIIKNLQSAHSMRRCLDPNGKSLFNYLRGCEYAGSAHLQTKASLILTAKFIVEDAKKDNVRYLCLRCAVDGYGKMKLQTQEEAIETLLMAFDHYTADACCSGRNTRVDLIVTAKRHKSVREFEENVRLAMKYRNGLALSKPTERTTDAILKDAFPAKAKVVSFDLAGLERGNRPGRFAKQFEPLLRECFPITIHAGEEDEAEAIWEAVYLVNSERIGHALTLRTNKDLMKVVRERHIAIELCPISNFLTSSKYEFRGSSNGLPEEKWDYAKDTSYPLRQYLNENLDVTINTDNPCVSSSNLTMEYLAAARSIGGLTKWEILRLIKNSFRAASIPKDEKRKLMNEIDDEIYELLLNEE